MSRLLGFLLLIVGIYYLSQDIVITTHSSPYWWRWIPADASILSIMAGVISVVFFRRQTGNFGWILLIVGVVLVFLSSGLILKPTNLWNFIVAFAAMAGGCQLITQGRLRF